MYSYSSLLTHKKLRFHFGPYTIICKLGDYCNFGLEQQSNNLHAHSSYELCLILDGEGTFVTDGKHIPIKAHDIIIANPYTYHEITCNNFSELSLLYAFISISHSGIVTPTATADCSIIDNFLHHHAAIAHNAETFFTYFDCINTYCQLQSTLDNHLYHLLKLLILDTLRLLTPSASAPKSLPCTESTTDTIPILPVTTLEKAQDYIDIHLHEKIYVEDIANYCNVSPRTLQYTFRQELNTSIVDYITERKIKLACHYLLNRFSIIDTANLIGFNNVSYFTKTFKKVMGLTPKQVYQLHSSQDAIGRRLD